MQLHYIFLHVRPPLRRQRQVLVVVEEHAVIVAADLCVSLALARQPTLEDEVLTLWRPDVQRRVG